jgi:non-ribosomal peptide synthetase component E (peptide arylation enzyme)
LYVVDESGREVQPGEIGELYVGGDLLATGYLNDAILTDQRFLPDDARGFGKKYRTGDLVREHAGGPLEFIGRVDDQVKVRGFRVELGEISNALCRIAGVRDAATVLLDPATGRLGAGVVLEVEDGPTAAELTRELAKRLPAYMVPPVIEPMTTLPALAVSGKVDSSALRRRLLGDSDGTTQ